jgi:hypothetical protein
MFNSLNHLPFLEDRLDLPESGQKRFSPAKILRTDGVKRSPPP